MLAGSVAASKLVGTDIATVGTITAGVWNAGAVTSSGALIGTSAGIGTTSVGSTAVLDVVSTTKGFLPPRMTTTNRDAISSPATGLTVYNTTTNALNVYNGTSWVAAASATPGGSSGQLQYNTGAALGGAAASAYATSGALFTLTAQAATDNPLILKGAASQSGDLLQVQNSSATVLTKVDSVGNVTLPMAVFAGVAGGVGANGSAGGAAGSTGQVQYNSSGCFAGAAGLSYATSGTIVQVTAQAATDVPLIVKGAVSQSGDLQRWTDSSNTVLHVITSAGNVGIGTSTPGYTLDVQAAAGSIRAKSTTGTNRVMGVFANTGGDEIAGIESSTGGSIFSGSSAYAAVLGHDGAYPLQFATSNTARVTIDSSGNVGIGTTSPSASVLLGTRPARRRDCKATAARAFGTSRSHRSACGRRCSCARPPASAPREPSAIRRDLRERQIWRDRRDAAHEPHQDRDQRKRPGAGHHRQLQLR